MENRLPEATMNGGKDYALLALDLSGAPRMIVDLMEKYVGGEESSEQSTFAEPPLSGSLRGANSRFPPSRSLRPLQQDGHPVGKWDCLDLDIVDACRGTSVSQTYRGNFKLYDGKCTGDFVDGLPIYISSDRPNRPLYIYPLGVYPDGWSVAALRGLVRWRIVSFENFDDKRSCRIETANVFQIEFAADGQPYNYYPTIYCFDQNGNDFSGFKSSTINIRCNDKTDTIGGNSPSDGGNNKVGVAIGIIVCLVVLVLVGYYFWKRPKNRGQILCPSPRPKSTDNVDCDSRYYPKNRAEESHNTRDSRVKRGSRVTRDNGTKDTSSRYTGDAGSPDTRKIGEYVDEAPLTSLKNDSPTYVNGNKTPDTVYVPTLEEEPSYIDDVIEDPINDLSNASEKRGNFPGKLKIPEMFSKLAQTTGNHSSDHISDVISDHQPNVSSPSPSPQRESRANSSSVPSRNSSHNTPVPAPSGHRLNGDSRLAPQRRPSRSAVSNDITDIVEKIDQELDEVIRSGEGSRNRNKDDSSRSPSMDDERADRARSRSAEDPPQRRFGGLGSSSIHIRDRPQNRAGGSQHREKDPLMNLSRRSKFREIRKTFSDRSRALGRTLAGDDKRSRSEERSRPETYAARGRDTSGHKDDRSRSMDRWMNANTNNGRSRSQSCTGCRGRERSNHGEKRDGRSLSRERSKVAEYYSNRNRPTADDRYDSNGYWDRDKKRNRSRSTDLSQAKEFANQNRPSKASASGHGSSPQTNRNFSDNKRTAASNHGGKRNGVPPGQDRIASSSEHSRKPTSDAWTSAGEQAAKRRGRSNSPERSRHDYSGTRQSPYKDRNRSQSKDVANEFADRKRRSSRDRSSDGPSDKRSSRNYSFSSPLETGGGRGTLDASNLNRSVTKNPDGSVTVAVKRTREDGAIVTTKTKYTSVSLAKRHGIEVD
ncbi:hypothetical protein IV203_019940 [Nitzschia inconspicua]|uniref:Uncharacterized protein n=1 Tax=Nitzschia inconspicua TaxID=303405 RepID=A0A9K3M0S7_9STRA|nr:hypothetical protein IV203_019940 [Nitzschia inconspicua]